MVILLDFIEIIPNQNEMLSVPFFHSEISHLLSLLVIFQFLNEVFALKIPDDIVTLHNILRYFQTVELFGDFNTF